MRPDVQSATARVIETREQLAPLPAGELPAQEIEDALCVGYAEALAADAWLTRAEERMWELIDDPSLPVRGSELRALTAERADYQRSVTALRRELAALRNERDRVRSVSHTRSA